MNLELKNLFSPLSIALLLIFLFLINACNEQPVPQIPVNRPIIGPEQRMDAAVAEPEQPQKMSEFEQMFRDSGLVDLEEYIPGILIDLKYTSTDNFVQTDVYGDLDKCFLRKEAAEKLKRAMEILHETHPNHNLLVFDGVRPFRVQQIMWDSLDMPFKRNYLSPPSQGSVHNYGCAVDLSIADSTGKEIDMGTEFDFFGPLAQPQLESQMLANGKLSQAQYQNRMLLRNSMKKAGFFDIKTEWWHFNAFGSSAVKRMFSRIP